MATGRFSAPSPPALNAPFPGQLKSDALPRRGFSSFPSRSGWLISFVWSLLMSDPEVVPFALDQFGAVDHRLPLIYMRERRRELVLEL